MLLDVFGWLLLASLTSLAALNSVSLGRLVSRRTSELAMVAALSFFALLAGPVLVLGYTNALTKGNLAGLAGLLQGGLFVALARGQTARSSVANALRSARDIAAMPGAALVIAARARSFAFVTLVGAYALIGYAFVLTILVPVTSWDGFLYHEPIIGFALQNHGFATVTLPLHETAQAINGYPRLCESLSIWLVIFTDRTLVELPNVLGAPALMLAVYALSRRVGDRLLSLTWASVIVLMPQVWAQLSQIYLDILVGFFGVGAIYFATRPTYRVRDALAATLALALLLGSKASALTLVPVIGLVGAARLVVAQGRTRPRLTACVVIGAIAFLACVGAVPLVRNLHAFGNPVWPVSYDNRLLGIHWKGIRTMQEMVADNPLDETIALAYDLPVRGLRDIIDRGYGYAFAWVIIPLGLVALLLALLRFVFGVVSRSGPDSVRNLAWVMLITVGGLFTTPTLRGGNARYNIHILAGLMVAITWLLRRASWVRIREGVIGASLFLSLYPFSFIDGYEWTAGMTNDVVSIFRHPFAHHSYVANPTFDRLGERRVRDIHAGDRVVFDQDIAFIGALWNFEYSNSVRFLSSDPLREFLTNLRAYDPTWVAVGNDRARAALKQSPDWELVGLISSASDQQVFHRIRRSN